MNITLDISRTQAIAASLFGLMLLFGLAACVPKDDTDSFEGRSGLMLYTDHLTGCQYLRAAAGGITPRMNAEGKHICTKVK